MADEGTPAAPPGNPLFQLANRLLNIQTWTQAGITIALGAAVLIGVGVYKYPQRIFELAEAVLFHQPERAIGYMSPLKHDHDRILSDLLGMFGGPSAMIGVMSWSVDLPRNQAAFVRGAFLNEYAPKIEQFSQTRW